MKTTINEDIKRIMGIMGISSSLLNEQVNLIPKPLIKKILGSADDVADPLIKVFNLSDNQIDNILRQIDEVGIDNLSDDLLELLSKSSIDNVDDLVKFMKVGKFLGSNFDDIALRIYRKVDTFDEISMERRNEVIKFYSDKLDELPFLDGADDIKEKLVRDFKSEFDSKYSDIISRNVVEGLSDELDGLFNQTERIMGQLDNVVEGMPANTPGRKKIQTAWKKIFYNRESVYDEIRRRSGYIDTKQYERAGNIKGMTDAEIEKLLSVSGDPMKTPRDADLVKAVSAAQNANYFTAANSSFMSLPKAVRTAFWTVLVTGGSALALGSSIIKILIGLMDIGSEKLDTVKISTDLVSLNNENIISHLSSELNMPEDMFQDWVIDIKNDKFSAIVENPAPDGKIYKVTLVTNEDEPEKNYIKSQEL